MTAFRCHFLIQLMQIKSQVSLAKLHYWNLKTMEFEGREIYEDQRGYYRFTDSDKLVHRWVVEKGIGRKIPQGCVIHHVNHDKHDNRFENLQITTWNEHRNIHKSDKRQARIEETRKGCLVIGVVALGLIALCVVYALITSLVRKL